MISAKTRSIQRNRVKQERIQNEVAISEAQCSIKTRMRRPNSKSKHLGRSRGAFHDHQHERLYETDFKDICYDLSMIRACAETKISNLLLKQTPQKPSKKARISLSVDKRIWTQGSLNLNQWQKRQTLEQLARNKIQLKSKVMTKQNLNARQLHQETQNRFKANRLRLNYWIKLWNRKRPWLVITLKKLATM